MFSAKSLVPSTFKRKSPGLLPGLSRFICPLKQHPVLPQHLRKDYGHVPRNRRKVLGRLPRTFHKGWRPGVLLAAGAGWRPLSNSTLSGTGKGTIPIRERPHTAQQLRRTKGLLPKIGKQGAARVVSIAKAAPRIVVLFHSMARACLWCEVFKRFRL